MDYPSAIDDAYKEWKRIHAKERERKRAKRVWIRRWIFVRASAYGLRTER